MYVSYYIMSCRVVTLMFPRSVAKGHDFEPGKVFYDHQHHLYGCHHHSTNIMMMIIIAPIQNNKASAATWEGVSLATHAILLMD